MLAEIISSLICPVCGDGLRDAGGRLSCPARHSFDIARQGYVNLLTGPPPAAADTADMVAARATLLRAGHFASVAQALARVAERLSRDWAAPPGLVVDAGAGTGYYLASVLTSLPAHRGVALDISKAAARRAARAHPRAAGAVCDIWRGLPVAQGRADIVLNVFAPRHASEFRRVLRPGGALLMVTPRPDHLGELVGNLGLVGVDPAKDERLAAALRDSFTLTARQRLSSPLLLSRDEAAMIVAMGPSAWHTDPAAVRERVATLPEPVRVTLDVDLRSYAPAR